MITLAGKCAERRARCRRPHWDPITRVATHEAGHACVSVALGCGTGGIIIEQKLDGSTRGVAFSSARPVTAEDLQKPAPRVEEAFKCIDPDFVTAVAFAKLLALSTGRSWLRRLHLLWHKTDAILERHWLSVSMLAIEVCERRAVGQERVQEILDRWMPVREQTLSAYLARAGTTTP